MNKESDLCGAEALGEQGPELRKRSPETNSNHENHLSDGDHALNPGDPPEGKEKDKLAPAVKKRGCEWQHHADLTRFESTFYLLITVGFIGYICYRVLRLSPSFFQKLDGDEDLRYEDDSHWAAPEGLWSWAGRAKDNTHTGWSVYRWYVGSLWFWYAGHLLTSAVLRRLGFSNRQRLFVLGVACVLTIGFRRVLTNLACAFIALVIAKGTKSIMAVWLFSLAALELRNYPDGIPYLGFTSFDFMFTGNWVFEDYYVSALVFALTLLRTISFCHEDIKDEQQRKTAEKNPATEAFVLTLVDLFNYLHYFPLFAYGPIMTYDRFEADLANKEAAFLRLSLEGENVKLLKRLALNTFRFGCWSVVTEAILYRVYFRLMLMDHNFLRNSTDLWELAGVGYWSFILFSLQYFHIFGFQSLVAHADGMTPPPQPKCAARVYLFSDMWKNFDTGLYLFMKRHLYIPLGGSRRGVPRQLIASFICFLFIYLWHGRQHFIFIWCALNYLDIVLETLGHHFSRSSAYASLETRVGPRMSRRLRVLAATPLFGTSLVSTLIFIGNHKEIGVIYAKRLVVEGFHSGGLILFLFFLYASAQSSVTFFKEEERKNMIKKTTA